MERVGEITKMRWVRGEGEEEMLVDCEWVSVCVCVFGV
jgi:hypothetical protein